MLNRAKAIYRRNKIGKALSFAIAFFIVTVFVYCASVLVTAYIDTPKVIARATSSDRLKLRLEDVPEEYQRILLTVEDPNFCSHHGVDVTTPGAGWTTITQGLVKVYFYDGFTPGTFRYRKLGQSLIAIVFNSRVDKRTQLLIFINSAYFGNHAGEDIVGFEDAAKAYYHKEFSQLTREEYISLVAMIVAPNSFNIEQQPNMNRERVARINRLLSKQCQPGNFRDVYYEDCK